MLRIEGEVAATGSGAEVLSGPLGILEWLANELAAGGAGLEAGEVVTTGSCTGVVPVGAGSRVQADFGSLGIVEAEF